MKPLEALRALGTGGEAPVEAKQRVQAALVASLSAMTASTAAAASAAAGGAGQSGPPVAGLTSSKVLAIAAGIWLIGGATGAALFGALRPQEVRVVYVDRPAPWTRSVPSATAPSAATAATTTSSTEPGPSDSSVVAAAAARRAPPTGALPSSELARERVLLDLARDKAARGEPASVLALAEQHRGQFPRGKLGEEREALAIRALISLGRVDEARMRARTFRLAYPNSILLPAIDSAMPAP